jgi:multidrug efflux pump subunit AcrA (membrane-fusion protein)
MRAVSNHEGPERQAAALAELKRLETEKAAAQQRAAEMAEAVRRAERQAAAERAGREQLLAEKAVAEQRAAELTSAARRTAELAEVARQAAERAEAERRERERLELEKARIEQCLLARSEEPLTGKRGAVERGRQPTALPSLGGRFNSESSALEGQVAPPPKPASRPSISGAFFQVDWDLADIAYESADDVLEVHQSISMTQLSLEGFPNQYCTAYIVALKKGKGRQVYVAFRLATSNRVLVYVPSSPPRNQDAYGRTMQEANKFLRVTGIETECLPLGKSSQSRTQALSQIPILRLHPRNAGNS